ncbi:MAG: hypothetical protein Q9221_001829 [Calogaya cf. arnoldii]
MDRGRDRSITVLILAIFTDITMSVLHQMIPTDHQTARRDRLSAPIAIAAIDLHPAELAHRLNMLSTRMLLALEEAVHEAALHDAVPEVLPQEEDLKEVDTVVDQDLLHPEPFLPGETATSDHPQELAVTPDLHHLPEPVLLHQ